jgi:hypothetical protein
MVRLPHVDLGVSRWLEIFPLQITHGAAKLAITNIIPTGKQFPKRLQERLLLWFSKWTGRVDDGELLRVGENHGRSQG